MYTSEICFKRLGRTGTAVPIVSAHYFWGLFHNPKAPAFDTGYGGTLQSRLSARVFFSTSATLSSFTEEAARENIHQHRIAHRECPDPIGLISQRVHQICLIKYTTHAFGVLADIRTAEAASSAGPEARPGESCCFHSPTRLSR